jgi:hypothetical protein
MRCLAFVLLVAACVPQGTQPSGGQPYGPQGAAQPGGFAGTWIAEGATLELEEQGGQIAGTLHGPGVQGTVQGAVQGGQLVGTFALGDGASGRFVATTDGARLTVNAEGAAPFVLERGGAAGPPLAALVEEAAGAAGSAGSRSAPPQEPPAGAAPALAGRPATGERVYDQYRGWEVKKPPGWKHTVRDGLVVLGHDTEPGVILVGYRPGVSFEQAAAAIDGEIRKLGATPAGAPRAASVGAGRALIAELSGVANGTAVHGRAVAVAGPSGVLVVLGLTTPDKLAGLRPRVDAVAMAARFFTPERGNVQLVSGCFRRSSGSTAVWVESTLYFDGAGRFSKRGFVAASSTDNLGRPTGTSASLERQGDGGSYTVEHSAIRLDWSDGSVSTYELVIERGAVGALKSGNAWYLRC